MNDCMSERIFADGVSPKVWSRKALSREELEPVWVGTGV